LGCGSDIAITQSAFCDGVLQGEEVTVDSAFDADGDGYFDGNNPDCASVYSEDALDCDDGDASVNPGEMEVTCDGVDNDCDALTEDAVDEDSDGYTDCEDCDDQSAERSPGNTEIACDEIDNDCNEETVDSIDQDVDGWDECEDCNDANTEINPGEEETPCDGVDNDCDELTLDEEDFDGDGVGECEDCDDTDELNSPDLDEVCGDEQDNDCDDDVDEGCSYSGTWVLDQNIAYQCAEFFGFYLVDVGFNQISITDNNPAISITAINSSQPGTTTGSFSTESVVSTSTSLAGSCTEEYYFSGEFLDASTFEGTFQAVYIGGASCYDCTTQVWAFTATR